MKEAAKVFGIIVTTLFGLLFVADYVHSDYAGSHEPEVTVGVILLAGGLTGAWMKWRN